jgi:hypothetical protein
MKYGLKRVRKLQSGLTQNRRYIMARIIKDNIEREINDAVKAKFIEDGWKEVLISFSSMKIADLKTMATEKGIQFDVSVKKEDLIQLLESAE